MLFDCSFKNYFYLYGHNRTQVKIIFSFIFGAEDEFPIMIVNFRINLIDTRSAFL